MSSFLPPDYEIPEAPSRYLSFKKDGKYTFRVLDSAIVGTELWINHRPVRHRSRDEWSLDEIEAADLDKDGNQTMPKAFWAFPVLHEGSVKVLELTQVTIMRPLKALAEDEDWGSPTGYDLVVERKTENGGKTSYVVQPKPQKPLPAESAAAWEAAKEAGLNLEALFAGGDPFSGKPAAPAPAAPRAKAPLSRSPLARPDYTQDEPFPTEEA